MPLDVVHIGNGIVHHQTQREDQGKQGHPVDGVPEQVVDKKGQGKADGHGQGHDHGFTPSQGNRQQDHHGDDGKQQRGQKIVDLPLGRGTIVAGHLDFDIVRDHCFFKLLYFFENVLGNGNGIGAFFLGHGQGDRRKGGRLIRYAVSVTVGI